MVDIAAARSTKHAALDPLQNEMLEDTFCRSFNNIHKSCRGGLSCFVKFDFTCQVDYVSFMQFAIRHFRKEII